MRHIQTRFISVFQVCNCAPSFISLQCRMFFLSSASPNASLSSHCIFLSYLSSNFLEVSFWSLQFLQPLSVSRLAQVWPDHQRDIQISIILVKMMKFSCFLTTCACNWKVLPEPNEVLLHLRLCMLEWLRACGGGKSGWAQIKFIFSLFSLLKMKAWTQILFSIFSPQIITPLPIMIFPPRYQQGHPSL